MTRVAAIVFAVLLILPASAHSADNPLVGTWKLKSYLREVAATGERYNERGEHPNGYFAYSADGRMYAIITWENRIAPRDVVPTNDERVKLAPTRSTPRKSFITSIFPGTRIGLEPSRCVSTSSTAIR